MVAPTIFEGVSTRHAPVRAARPSHWPHVELLTGDKWCIYPMLDFEARLHENLFRETTSEENEDQDFTATLNPNSLEVRTAAKIEPGVEGAVAGTRYQFERVGYFCVDKDSTADKLVFNRTVQLRDTWAKIEKSQKSKA